jgi:fructose-specific component phosphotransferase system IIB-like protein
VVNVLTFATIREKNIFVNSSEDEEVLIIGKAGEGVEAFDKELEGKHVVVKGILRAAEVESEEEVEVHHDVEMTYYIEVSEVVECKCDSKCNQDKKCCDGHKKHNCKDSEKKHDCKDKEKKHDCDGKHHDHEGCEDKE